MGGVASSSVPFSVRFRAFSRVGSLLGRRFDVLKATDGFLRATKLISCVRDFLALFLSWGRTRVRRRRDMTK